MRQYLGLLQDIAENGVQKTDRTGVGTLSVFGRQLRFDLSQGFPAVTTKKLFMRAIVHELLWFLQGSSNIKYLVDNDVHIWDEWPFKAYLQKQHKPVPEVNSPAWKAGIAEFSARIVAEPTFAKANGELGPVYGYQWRSWPTPGGGHIDQIAQLVDTIKHAPDSRRMIVSAWNVADIEAMAKAGLPPCHCLFQFYVANGKLSCQLYQRSADMFLGVPFNIASYALLTLMIAQVTGLQPGEFIHTFGDAHIYQNHRDQVATQLARDPLPLPTLRLNQAITSIFDFTFADIKLENYTSHPAIWAPIAV